MISTSSIPMINETRHFLRSYLFSYLFWADLPLGAFPLLMIYHLTGGKWGAIVRKILEALCDTLPLTAIFSLPILIWISEIYPWMIPEIALEPDIIHKKSYLNPQAFALRTLLYFICWLSLNHFLQRRSRPSDNEHSDERRLSVGNISAGGLILFVIAVTFASVDWQMSVEPHWYSTVYGLVYISGQTLQAYAFVLITFSLVSHKKGYLNRFPKEALRDLGNILLTLVMVWAYLSFMQYLIIWSGNLPHEVTWFNHRTQGGWQWLALLLVLFQFLAPFLALLLRGTKDNPLRLTALGLLIFLIRIVDHYWMLMPGLFPEGFDLHWDAVLCWVGMGAIWLAFFIRRFRKQSLFAEQDQDWPLPSNPPITPDGEPFHA
ncbi:MAG: hypothetical protein ABIQ95_01040 [Bdellovibrionia bacterium]